MDSSSGPGFDDEPPPEPRDGWLLVRIHVPELNVYKCLQFPSDRLVWDVKQQVLASLPKELKESFNYGLFCPPSNGKAGKFLDEERRLGEYPFNGPVGYLELKYKRRVYKMLNLDERQLKSLHTRANLRRFLECINGGHVEKIAKMCAKGLDPNFHCPESGETPLTVATGAKKPNKLLIALVNGGAILDYRTKDGTTALHRAVEKDSLEAVTTLLELGASPNYKDGRGITPLYISITRKCESKITETLLHDHAILGVQDNQGWNEVHQACRHGLIQHLEHLLFYGADMDAQNASGNTPLHVCAVNNQEACARMLLFRGAQRGALNYANQTPYQVAVIAGNMELAEIIQNYKSEDVVPFRGPPRYNPKRRSGTGWLHANECAGVGNLIGPINRNNLSVRHGPPSPCPSEHLPYSSASSSLSEGSSGHRSHEDDISIVTDKSLGDTSDIISDSSGVGTNSDSAACSIGHPSTTVICMESYASNTVGHIRLQQGDVIEVVGSTDCGLLEGYVRGTNQSGFFPADNVQEVSLRQKNITNVLSAATGNHSSYQHSAASSIHQGSPQLSVGGSSGIGGSNNGTLARKTQGHRQSPSLSLNSTGSNIALNGNHSSQLAEVNNTAGNNSQINHYSSATAPRIKKPSFNEPRTVVLHRAKRGFGFILRGAKASSQLMQLKPSERFPALQYLDDVDPGGVADMAGLHPGDFLLAINGEDVRAASHEKVVEMIRSAGALVSMTVISPQFPNQMQPCAPYSPINHISSGPNTPQTTHRQCATLPRKMSMGPGVGGRMPAPMPPRRDPKTTLSVGRARAKSMVAGLENGGDKDENDIPHCKSSSVESIVTPTPTHPSTPVQLRTASIKARPTSSRITAAELEELFQRQQGEAVESSNRYSTMMTTSRFQSGTDCGTATPPTTTASPIKGPLVYASVAEMKRKTKIKNGTLRGKPCAIPTIGGGDLKRFHSTPDLMSHSNSNSSIWHAAGKNHHSQDDVATLHASMQRLNTCTLPPPNHPPPPPPVGQVVKVETRSNNSEYESTISLQQKLKKRAENDAVTSAAIDGVQSSFNPSANAKIYASPQELRNVVAWKLRQTQEIRQNGQKDFTLPQSNSNQNNNSDSAAVPKEFQQPQISHYSQPLINKSVDSEAQNVHYAPPQEKSQLNTNSAIPAGPAPPIPEPDYSLSESDGEDENSILVARNTKLNEKIALIDVAETSANSNNSGSSNSSTNISHSLSVEEIKRIRSNLKTSKSSPNGFIKQGEENATVPTEGNTTERNGANEVENSSSGVSRDLEVGTVGGQKSTDTIKKTPKVTIVEGTKNDSEQEALGTNNNQRTTSITIAATKEADASEEKNESGIINAQTASKIEMEKINAPTNANNNLNKIATTSATVTVKQMVQQQHAPVIQQQQQKLADTKLKSNVVQSQQANMKVQPNVGMRIVHASQKVPPSPSGNDGHLQHQTTTKGIATQQQLLQQQQQQITHQQHLQQILKAKGTASSVSAKNTAAVVSKQQQQLQRANAHPTNAVTLKSSLSIESEQEQRSDDDGELSPSPPAKAFQRHNSLTRKQAAAIAMQRASRHSPAVSLIQLPPPIETEIDNDTAFANNATGSTLLQHGSNVQSACSENIVLAPPPQFCDCNDVKHSAQLQQQYQQHHQQQRQAQAQFVLLQHQQQLHHHQQQQQINTGIHYVSNSSGRVRIVGAIPKSSHRTHTH